MNMLALVFALSAGMGGDGWRPIDKDHFINFLGVWGEPASRGGEIAARVTYSEPGVTFRTDIGYRFGGRQPSPMATLRFSAKYWNIFNDFARNPGVMWTYRDKFMVNGVQFDRSELEDFPDLQRRVRNAKWSFERVEVQLTVNRRNGTRHDVVFTHDGVQMIVPSEGRQPITAPGSPRKWSDALRTLDGSVSEKEWPKVWREIDGVVGDGMNVHFIGLRFPDQELAAIMKEARDRKKKKKELEKEYESIFDSYVAPVKPYNGGGDEAQPYEAKVPEVAHSNGQYRLMIGSRTLVSLPEKYVSKVERMPDSQVFAVSLRDGGLHLYDKRGQQREIDGHRAFMSVFKEGSKLIARAEISRGSKDVTIVCPGPTGGNLFGPYDSYSDAMSTARDWAATKKADQDQRMAKAGNGFVLCLPDLDVGLMEVNDYEIDPKTFAKKKSTRRYMLWSTLSPR